MKLAIIPPTAYLGKYSTKYHLILAHLYRESEAYRNFYNERRQKGDFVIMDNGAAELGSSIQAEDLVIMALELRPSVLICPDVLRDKDKTLEATNRFLDTYSKKLHENGIKLLAVPQGATATEWEAAFMWFNADPAIDWLGISKYVRGAFPSRLDALRLINKRVRKPCHLLGMADDTFIIEQEKKFKFAKSTDTAVPVKLGMQSLSLAMYNYRGSIPDAEYFGQPAGAITDRADAQILTNIKYYQRLCK